MFAFAISIIVSVLAAVAFCWLAAEATGKLTGPMRIIGPPAMILGTIALFVSAIFMGGSVIPAMIAGAGTVATLVAFREVQMDPEDVHEATVFHRPVRTFKFNTHKEFKAGLDFYRFPLDEERFAGKLPGAVTASATVE